MALIDIRKPDWLKQNKLQYQSPVLGSQSLNTTPTKNLFWNAFGTGQPPQTLQMGKPAQPRMLSISSGIPSYTPNLRPYRIEPSKPLSSYSPNVYQGATSKLPESINLPQYNSLINNLGGDNANQTNVPQQNSLVNNLGQDNTNQTKKQEYNLNLEQEEPSGGKYDFNTFKVATGGLDTSPFLGALAGNVGAGAMGLAGNLIQTALLRRFQPDYREIASEQGKIFDELMGKYAPQFTTNRLGQFGEEAAVEAQRRSLESTYSPAAIANMAAMQSSASALENLGALLGSQALQNQQMQNANMLRQLRNQALQMGASPAALAAIARAGAEQQGQNLAQALSSAAQAASQNIAQAAALRGQGLQGLEASAQRVYETYKRPAETMTDYGALIAAAQTPYRQGMQIGESLTVMPANPLKPAGDIWAGLTNAAAEQAQYQKRMELALRNLSNLTPEYLAAQGITPRDLQEYYQWVSRQQLGG